ncbi:MAG: alpha/beta hydrolase [Geminicoccaceae bacterium]
MTVVLEECVIPFAGGGLHASAWIPSSANRPAPVLLFHDSLGCVELWRDFPSRLAAATGRTVVAYDRLGFGRSSRYPGRMGPDLIEREAMEVVPLVIGHFGIVRFAACGHSIGGGMALETAARFQQACEAVITIGAQAFVEDRTRAGIRRAESGFADPDQFARLTKYHGDKARWVLESWTGNWLSDEFAGWTNARTVERVACPILAIHGADDEYGSIEHPARITAHGGRMEILDGVGHFPHRQDEARVVALTSDFLASNGDGPTGRAQAPAS